MKPSGSLEHGSVTELTKLLISTHFTRVVLALQVAVQQLRDRLSRALGQQPAAPVQPQRVQPQPSAPRAPQALPRHPFTPAQPAMVPQPGPAAPVPMLTPASAPAPAQPQYYQPVRAAFCFHCDTLNCVHLCVHWILCVGVVYTALHLCSDFNRQDSQRFKFELKAFLSTFK